MNDELFPLIVTPPPGPRSRQLAERLARVESRNVTYLGPEFPVFWDRARGALVTDVDGNRYLDFTSAFGVTALGHQDARITARLAEQAGILTHGMGDIHPTELKVLLLERLQKMSPWPDARAVLASAGSEAVEIALKTAELATGRSGILAFRNGYHGLTLGALAATGREDFKAPFRGRVYGGVTHVPFPGRPQDLDDALDQVEGRLRAQPHIGAVIVEPIQARGGVRVPPGGFLSGLVDRARAAGALVIFDEIFTGFGRTGHLFAHQHDGVAPDLMCVGKALGGGMPISACLGPQDVMDAWPHSTGEALHTSTFLGHPLTCAAALTFLDALEGHALVEGAAEVGGWFQAQLRERFQGMGSVAGVRGRGLLAGVELAPAALRRSEELGGVIAMALKEGLLVLPSGANGEVVELIPPLTMAQDQLEKGMEILEGVLTTLAVGT